MIATYYEEVEKYILKRLSHSQNYRGMHLAQHNRLPIEKLAVILRSIDIATDGNWFIEPSSDDPAPTRNHVPSTDRRIPRGMSASDCVTYYAILDQIVWANIPKVSATFNSLKKNIFPNLEGMGLLERDSSGRRGSSVKKARLTDIARRFLSASDRDRQKIFSESNEKILKPMVEVLDEAFNRYDTISVYEMMLFLSDESITVSQRLDLVGAYKRLKKVQVIFLHESTKQYMNRRMGADVSKIEKLDWHNWWNESRQITDMLETVIGFNVYQDEQIMKAGNAAAANFSPTRSQTVKKDTLAWNNLQLIPNWELHHILPIEYATSKIDLVRIDSKENLLYIPAQIHRSIPNTSNLSIKFSYDASHVILSNPLSTDGDPSRTISWPRDAGVAQENLETMVNYNTSILELVI